MVSYGRLELVIGCMYSGKSTELIKRIRKHQLLGKNILVINHSSDKRYSNDSVVCSHNLDMVVALRYEYVCDCIEEALNRKCDAVFIDEAHFFPDLFTGCVELLETHGINVIVCGLDGTYERKPFMNVLSLIPYADEVMRLTALCLVCKDGTPAAFSKRTVDVGDRDEFVGGVECYKSVCRRHFIES